MEDQSKNLLTKKNLTDYYFVLREAEKEFEKTEAKWALIGKYHQRLFFQKAWRKNEDELIAEYKELARQMERLEESINEYKTKIYLHTVATEELHNSMTPFKGIHLQQHQLQQKELF